MKNETPETGARNEQRRAQVLNTTLSAWDLRRSVAGRLRENRVRQMILKTHERLRSLEEAELGVPKHHRSYLKVGAEEAPGVLLVHDAQQSPADLKALGQALGAEGFTVYAIRLAGSVPGTHERLEIRWRATLQQVRLAHRVLSDTCCSVHVVAIGFGAVLALHLAAKERVAGLVLIAPSLVPQVGFWIRLLWATRLLRLRPVKKRAGRHMDASEGMKQAQNLIGKLKVPIYGVHCEDDQQASPQSLRLLQKRARHPRCRFQAFPSGGHDVLAAHGQTGLVREIVRFIGS